MVSRPWESRPFFQVELSVSPLGVGGAVPCPPAGISASGLLLDYPEAMAISPLDLPPGAYHHAAAACSLRRGPSLARLWDGPELLALFTLLICWILGCHPFPV